MLRDETDTDSRSVLLSIIARHKGDASALDWFADQNLSTQDLAPNGILALCQIHMRRENFKAVKQTLFELTDAQLRDTPYFLLFRGALRFAMVLARPEQAMALAGLPLDVRFARPILPDQQLATELDAARSDLERFLSAAERLEMREAPRLAEAYLTWCDLLHPQRQEAGLLRLRSDMGDPTKALSRVQFAFAYDADQFDPAPLAKYLEKREALGGLSSDELRAALVLRIHSGDPASIAQLIARHRAQFEQSFVKLGIVAIEIQALAMAGDPASARLLLDANRKLLGTEGVARLSAEIARAEGADPVTAYKRVYEANPTADNLRVLLSALLEKNEHRAIGRYAEELFGLTGDPHDITNAARAYAQSGDDDNFVRVIEAHPVSSRPGIAFRKIWRPRAGRSRLRRPSPGFSRRRSVLSHTILPSWRERAVLIAPPWPSSRLATSRGWPRLFTIWPTIPRLTDCWRFHHSSKPLAFQMKLQMTLSRCWVPSAWRPPMPTRMSSY